MTYIIKVDLIDLRTNPDGEYKYIVHARDHFSRYSWASLMKSKEVVNVAGFLFTSSLSLGLQQFCNRRMGKNLLLLQVLYANGWQCGQKLLSSMVAHATLSLKA